MQKIDKKSLTAKSRIAAHGKDQGKRTSQTDHKAVGIITAGRFRGKHTSESKMEFLSACLAEISMADMIGKR